MRLVLAMAGLLALLTPQVRAADSDRLTQAKRLVAEYEAADKKYFDKSWPQHTVDDNIRRYEAWPGWTYLPKFVKLAEVKPDDEAAFLCCQWILERTNNVGNADRRIFDADQKAWEILATHPLSERQLPTLCLTAAFRHGRGREEFLQAVLDRKELSRENRGIATAALAELIAQKYEIIESREFEPPATGFAKYLEGRFAPAWGQDLVSANSSKFKAQSIELFRQVLANYGDVPLNISLPNFRHIDKLRDKATKSLHALEHLTIGSAAPGIVGKDLHGRPLDLAAYRGRVVMLSFWFTGCGPCMGMVPQEQRLVKKYDGSRFALLSICGDESIETANKTAVEHKMDWPCWFDGSNGPIARNWNVLGWPTIYILNEQGVIVAKQLRGDPLDTKLAELLEKKTDKKQ